MIVDRRIVREKLQELEKLRPELMEEAMGFIDYLIHREKEKQGVPGMYDTHEIKILSDE